MKCRRPGIYLLFLPVLFAMLLTAAGNSLAAARPNIVVILSDDMGFSDVGCYGSEIQTPTLDQLAGNGLRFTQFYNTARCCPTRASLLTGLYPHQAGVGHMMEDRDLDGYQGDLNQHCVTIAEALKPAGYRTYATGKWHVTPHTKPEGPKHNWPLQRGFDRFYGTIHGAGNYWDPSALVRDNRMITAVTDPEYRPPVYYYTDAISDQAARFVTEHVRDHSGDPFFMYVAYTAAHWPLHAREEDIAKYRGKYDGGYEPIRNARFAREKQLGLIPADLGLSPQAGDWASVANKDWEARCMEVYAAQIDSMDQGIGRVVAALKKTGQFENTLILFLQDNGGCAETLGRSGRVPRAAQPTLPPLAPDYFQQGSQPKQTRDGWPVLTGPAVMPGPADTFIAYGKAWANVSNTPFREYKHWVHEGGIATPLIAHWPAGIKVRGELRRQPGHLIDIMPTCLDLAKAKYPAERNGLKTTPLEGRSLQPAFADHTIKREALYWEHEGNRAVRVDNWKLVAKGPGGKWELYDLEKDRSELHDLADKEPARVKKMISQWESYAKRANVLPWIWRPAYGQPEGAAGAPEADARLAGKKYALKPGDDLSRDQAPPIGKRGFVTTVKVLEWAPNGVLIAQGGRTEGFSVYVADGKLAFAIRRGGQLSVITAAAALPTATSTAVADLDSDGAMTLRVDGKAVASGKADGALLKTPVEGLQVGRDAGATVGDYAGPFPFAGRLGEVSIELR